MLLYELNKKKNLPNKVKYDVISKKACVDLLLRTLLRLVKHAALKQKLGWGGAKKP